MEGKRARSVAADVVFFPPVRAVQNDSHDSPCRLMNLRISPQIFTAPSAGISRLSAGSGKRPEIAEISFRIGSFSAHFTLNRWSKIVKRGFWRYRNNLPNLRRLWYIPGLSGLFFTLEGMTSGTMKTHDSFNGTKRSFEVGLLRSEDADGVVRLFRSVHGEEYPIKIFYDPIKLIKANEEGDYYSVVAKSKHGEIIGIHNLFRSAPSRDVYEWGVGLVLKEWRSEGVSWAIEHFMIEKVVPERGMHTVFGEPVTTHLHMQKHSIKHGFETMALEVGLMPGEAYSGEGVTSHRVSTLLCFRRYREIPQQIFLPGVYNEALRFIYGDFSSGRTFFESTDPIPLGTASKATMELFDFAKVARISVYETGSDFPERIADLESEAVNNGFLVIQVWVKLTSPWVGAVVEALRSRGYFLGGALPQWFDDDGLLMQKILFMPDFESIQLYSDRALRIRDFVKADWSRSCEK